MNCRQKKNRLQAFAIVFCASILCCGCSQPSPNAKLPSSEVPQQSLIVFLVRHAEKADKSRDTALSEVGLVRAQTLANVLRNAQIDHVHSSDFIRTRDTAAPTAESHGLEITLYDPANLSPLVEKIRRSGGRHLVVGHSNTTPELVTLLGGEAGSPINEASEFDRLYIVSDGTKEVVSTIQLTY